MKKQEEPSMPRNRRNIARSLLAGFLAAALFTIAAMLLLAASLICLSISDGMLTVLNQLVKYGSVLLGTCIAVSRGSERGLATGIALALAYSAAGYALYLALGGGSFAVGNMLGEMLLGSAVGAVTGAVRANMKPKSRFRAAKV